MMKLDGKCIALLQAGKINAITFMEFWKSGICTANILIVKISDVCEPNPKTTIAYFCIYLSVIHYKY